ncbi:hypothetical protein PC114_g26590 [Phytophthora cactorum]|uniref:Uncharacterized protein n=1 Tax=Phytophthora cactorum TaxID=29920 RepID=A0A8T1AJT2_9STRA|nr:hypothetical protein PC114_g26590 [Phytophthora cactorum]KAG2880826.1 hypothetical protein PC117_g26494 [Phytophthora cactorum]
MSVDKLLNPPEENVLMEHQDFRRIDTNSENKTRNELKELNERLKWMAELFVSADAMGSGLQLMQ